jgi:hypothetical protein
MVAWLVAGKFSLYFCCWWCCHCAATKAIARQLDIAAMIALAIGRTRHSRQVHPLLQSLLHKQGTDFFLFRIPVGKCEIGRLNNSKVYNDVKLYLSITVDSQTKD